MYEWKLEDEVYEWKLEDEVYVWKLVRWSVCMKTSKMKCMNEN